MCPLPDLSRRSLSVTEDEKALSKKMAVSALIGAVIAIPVPFVGPIVGAIAGAGFTYFRAKKRG
ncbi:MAG: hypothetical protein B7Y43_04740 [Sphingomonas sp. 28-62-20]|nr:hypothetical protein [Sphingomonas sp.]OYY78854.1 MAG: hypothetical protein B7Y43_04740 [Sphingomonas sp. 28-62-20]